MKIRTDLTAFSLTGLCVVAMVAVVLAGREVPELLTTITLVSLGVSGGAAVPTVFGRTASSSTSVDVEDLNKRPGTPSNPVPAPAQLVGVPVQARVPEFEHVFGRDMTETFPAITAEQVAADKAPR